MRAGARRPMRKWRTMKRLFFVACLMLPALAAGAASPKVADTVAERAKPCLACHAAEGRKARDEYYPRLAGKPAGYLFNQMQHFRDGGRRHRAMGLLMEHLSDAYLRELAGYFSALAPAYSRPRLATANGSPQAPPLLTLGDIGRQLPACISCHGKELLGAAPAIPGLLGLPRDYVSAQLGAWKVGTRRAAAPDCMGSIARQLTEAEVNAVATWLAAQPLPANSRPAAAPADELPLRCGSVPNPPVAKVAP